MRRSFRFWSMAAILLLCLGVLCMGQTSSPAVLLDSAVALYYQDDNDGAMKLVEKVLKAEPQNPAAYRLRGQIKDRLRQYEEALADFQKAHKFAPQDGGIACQLAEALGRAGDHAGEIRVMDIAMQLQPKNVYFILMRGLAKETLGDLKGAMADYDQAVRVNGENELKSSAPFETRGLLKKKMRDYAGAMKDLDEAIRLSPEDWSLPATRAEAKESMGDAAGAVADLDKAMKTGDRPSLLATRARIKARMGNLKDAEVDLNDLAKKDPSSTLYLADFLRDQKRFNEAAKVYDRILKDAPTDCLALVGRGILQEMMTKPDEALADYEAAIKLNSYFSSAAIRKAMLLGRKGKTAEALKELDNVLKRCPADDEALVCRAAVRERLGDAASAAKDRLRASEVNPELAAATGPLATLNTLGDAEVAVVTNPTPPTTPTAKPTPSPTPIDLGEKPTVPDLPTLPPTTLSATQIAPFLDINRVTATQWAGAVSAAMEGTRLVYGPMTPEQAKVFEGKWVHMFDFPFKEGIDWLNELNPLLGQFLAIRATMADTAIQFDGAWKEAVTAAAIHNEQSVREALSIAFMERQMLIGLQKQLDQVVKDIIALGDPPSAQHHRRKKQQEHDDAVKETRKLVRQLRGAPDDKPTPTPKPEDTGRWVQTKVETVESKLAPPDCKAAIKYNADNQSVTIDISGIYQEHLPGGNKDHPVACSWKMKWDRPPLTYNPHKDWPKINASIECVSQKMPAENAYMDKQGHWHTKCSTGGSLFAEEGSLEKDGKITVWSPNGNQDFLAAGGTPGIPFEIKPRQLPRVWFGWKASDKRTFVQRSTNLGMWCQGLPDKAYYVMVAHASIGQMSMSITKIFQYEWDPTGSTLRPDAATPEDTLEPKEPDIRPRTPEELAEEIGFYQDTIKIIQANMAKDKEELDRTTDGDRRTALVERIILGQNNIQSEQDLITTLQTGQIVHTRTAWDEMQSAAFIRNCQAEVNDMASRDRLRVGTLRMVGRADPQQAERLRKFVLDHSDPAADSAKLKKIAHIVYNQVQGDLEAKAARSEEEAVSADQNLAYVESVKSTCDKAMFVGALLGGHSVMVAYQGAIGFIEGPQPPTPEPGQPEPPTDPSLGGRVFEGVKRAAAWYNMATFVAVEAFDGYEKGGYIGGKENKGAWGAVERAGEAFLLAKAFEYGVGRVLGTGKAPAKQTVKEQFELAKYRQECEYGKSLAEDYKRTFAEYRRIQEFGASAAEMAAMEKQLQQKAASMHSSFESKLYLKELHGQGKDAAMLEDYVFRIDKNHAATREAWFRKMEAQGYDDVRQWKLMEFRNSASAGSPGMDHDMGIRDIGEKFYKDRLRVSKHAMNEDAQKAWEQAYQETTGYSARQSFENITTSIHVEAYRDLAWIGDASIKHAKVNEILSGWAGQAADVTAVKNYDMFKNLPRLQAIVESSRGMAKDIQTKLLPVLEEGAVKFPKSALRIRGGVEPASGKQVTGLMEKWSQIRDILKTAADNPVEADRKIRMLTGKSICEVTADLRDLMANFGKAIGK